MNHQLAYKYILNENGIIFIIEDYENKEIAEAKLVKIEGRIFLKLGGILNLLTPKIVKHIESLLDDNERVNFAWYKSNLTDYEIDYLFSKSLSRADCSRIAVMYELNMGEGFENMEASNEIEERGIIETENV